MTRRVKLRLLAPCLLMVATLGCQSSKDRAPSGAASASASAASAASAAPSGAGGTGGGPSGEEARKLLAALPAAEVVQPVVNPGGLAPYQGETGVVEGVVRSVGDLPPTVPSVLAKIESDCQAARDTFGHAVREGAGRTLADVLVAVTEYKGYVPPESDRVELPAEGCAFASRTVAVTFGQALRIVGKDRKPYVPEILGMPMPAQLFVIPSSPILDLAPRKPGRFRLLDSLRLYNISELFVLPFSTHAVTGLDGKFHIGRIPVGKARVSVLHPVTGATEEREIEVTSGRPVVVEFALPLKAAVFENAVAAEPGAN